MRCTYKNTIRHPVVGLAIRKVSLGGGAGHVRLLDRRRGRARRGPECDDDRPWRCERVQPAPPIAQLPSGHYTVTDTLPPDVGGTWRLASVDCNPGGSVPPDGNRAEIVVPTSPNPGVHVHQPLHTSRPDHAAQDDAREHRVDAVPGARPQLRVPRPEREQLATTTTSGQPAVATGDSLDKLPIGQYSIQETIGGTDRWELPACSCEGVPAPAVAGRILIELTPPARACDCTFVNRRIRTSSRRS